MSFWSALRSRFTGERKMNSLDLLHQLYGGRLSKSGASVNWQTALEVTTVLACARVIAEGIAQVPFGVYRANGKSRLPALDHPLNVLLARRPNDWQTSFEYRETIGLHLVLTGNHYSFINEVRGQIIELIPFEPQWVRVLRGSDMRCMYEVTPTGGPMQLFAPEQIWHIRGPSWNSYLGMEAVFLAREAIGLALSTEEAHSRLHANGVQTSGTYSVEGTLSDEQHKRLTEWLEKAHAGSFNSRKPMVMDRAAKWLPQAMTGVDAQHLETRRFQIEEVCRALRVMPIMVGYSDKASTYASAEQMFLAHVVHTLSPWYERIEQSVDVQLLRKDCADGYYANFDEEGLMRAAMKDTAKYLLDLVNGGIITPNEGRAKLDLNPDDDPASDELRIPANIVGALDSPDPAAEPKPAATNNPKGAMHA